MQKRTTTLSSCPLRYAQVSSLFFFSCADLDPSATPGSNDTLKEKPPRDRTIHHPASRIPVAMPPRINLPPVTRALLGTLLFQSVLSAAIRYRQWAENTDIVIPYLTLIPQLSIAYPWTFLTASLVEGNIFTFGLGAVTLYHGGRYLERAWSSADLAKFLLLVTLVPNVLTFFTMVFLFTLTRNTDWT